MCSGARVLAARRVSSSPCGWHIGVAHAPSRLPEWGPVVRPRQLPPPSGLVRPPIEPTKPLLLLNASARLRRASRGPRGQVESYANDRGVQYVPGDGPEDRLIGSICMSTTRVFEQTALPRLWLYAQR